MSKVLIHLQHENAAKLLIRLTVGVFLLLHGIAKIGNTETINFIVYQLANLGLPGFFAYGVYVGELIAPIMLIVGFQTRMAGLLIAANMMFAIALVHMGDIFTMAEMGGWSLELQGFFLFGSLTIALLGKMRISPAHETIHF